MAFPVVVVTLCSGIWLFRSVFESISEGVQREVLVVEAFVIVAHQFCDEHVHRYETVDRCLATCVARSSIQLNWSHELESQMAGE